MLNLHGVSKRDYYNIVMSGIHFKTPTDRIVANGLRYNVYLDATTVEAIRQEYTELIKKLTVNALQKIKDSDWSTFADIGLCMSLGEFVYREIYLNEHREYLTSGSVRYARSLFSDSFESWPEFTGSQLYPVPAPLSFKPCAGMTSYSQAYSDLPHWTGEYGKSRLSLLEHAIKYLQ
ncbi:hypothetical protein KNT64_gp202 [Pseudomonas phage PspYZU05]|uniref:Uncharacterized protein n=1 Tax=Pseudomonas phage PspYZU05 TaxID=1983556 RepID=A0A2U7NJM6_9CAUD|nr:hypothetical protein KNT64_gp202 [Pseudomonas phage PspYZU05]ASD52154.1 hypothetical protein PspYZU05_202 [Pseudomonas phage PspYZU05]